MRWQSIIGWPLIFVQLLVFDPYREVIIAIQTFICAILSTLKLHNTSQNTITIFIVILTCFTHSNNYPPSVLSIGAYHTIIAATTVANYITPEHLYIYLTTVAWSVKWLSYIIIWNQSPIRAAVRFVLFALVSNKRFGKQHVWYWVLMVHEFAFIFIPVQMLFEVYKNKKTKINNSQIV